MHVEAAHAFANLVSFLAGGYTTTVWPSWSQMLWRTTQACHICESVSGQGWTSDLYSVLRFIHVHFWWNNCYISWSAHPFQTSMNCFTLTNVISECCSENSMKYSCNINSVMSTAYTVSSLVKFLSDYNLCPMLCHLLYVLDSGSLFLLVFFLVPCSSSDSSWN